MIDLVSSALPDTVEVDGKAYSVNTDFRYWLQFERDLKQFKKTMQEFDVTYLFKGEKPRKIDVRVLIDFANPHSEIPRPLGQENDAIVIDFDIDSDLIYAAFIQQYGINLLTARMHWHEFRALLASISSETTLGQVMGYRSYKKSSQKRDIREELRRRWEILPELSDEEQAELDEFASQFA